MREDLIAELRELCAIEGRPLMVGERARTKIAMSEAAAALEAAREALGREAALKGGAVGRLRGRVSGKSYPSPKSLPA